MTIAIIGNGAVGNALGGLLADGGHEVTFGGRGGPGVRPVAEAARAGRLIVLAVPFTAVAGLAAELAPAAVGKVVVDATNPLGANWSPLELPGGESAGEQVQRMLPGARVVKAFNTVFADNMRPDRLACDGRRLTAFVAGDDAAARATVAALARDAGFEPVETGPLRTARYLEAIAHLNIQLAVGMGAGTHSGFLYVRKT